MCVNGLLEVDLGHDLELGHEGGQNLLRSEHALLSPPHHLRGQREMLRCVCERVLCLSESP